jgi:hypothetical protein
MPDKEKDKKRKKRLVSIVAYTSEDIFNCEDVIADCLKKLDHAEYEIIILVKNAKIRILNGNFTTLVKVTGDSTGGLRHSGMRKLCECLQESGFYVQFRPSYFDHIPSGK